MLHEEEEGGEEGEDEEDDEDDEDEDEHFLVLGTVCVGKNPTCTSQRVLKKRLSRAGAEMLVDALASEHNNDPAVTAPAAAKLQLKASERDGSKLKTDGS